MESDEVWQIITHLENQGFHITKKQMEGKSLILTITLSVVEAASLLNTPTAISSIPIRLPWLSSIGTIITILKFALGATVL